REYSGLPGGPGRFTAHSTSALLLGNHDHNPCDVFAYGALTHYGRPSQKRSTNTTHRPSEARQSPYVTNPTTPHPQPLPGITRTRFSHHPLSLATTHGITIV